MGNVHFEVEFLADVQRGEITKTQLQDALIAAGFTNPTTHSVSLIFKGVSKTLSGARVTSPVADQAAVEAVLLATFALLVGPAVPDPLFLTNLSTMSFATLVLTGSAPNDEQVRCGVSNDGFGGFTTLGTLNVSGYADGGANPGRLFASVIVQAREPSDGFTIPASDLTVTDSIKGALVLLNADPIVIAAPVGTGLTNQDSYYIDDDLKLYLGGRLINGSVVVPFRSFADAVAAGSV